MSWPLPDDFNEAVQSPATAFADADLRAGEAVCGPTGLPLPRSGNFADVYQIRGVDGRDWAIKCFTRPVVGLDKRYAAVGAALAAAKLPFTIPFAFLPDGVRAAGKVLPGVKMEWVDGLMLNQFVRDNAARPAILDSLLLLWTRLCKRLREAGLAHADLQHGNVLLVPGAKPGQFGLKLIDYDGMYVPALANVPSGELGHAAYQHPGRAAGRVYSPDLDRFPHLVIATALKGLTVNPALWDKYDTGDNLLFTEDDFRAPARSQLLKDLWQTGHPAVQGLVGRLVLACGKPIPQTPWLDHIAPEGKVQPLPHADAQAAMAALGFSFVTVPAVPVQAVPVPATPVHSAAVPAPPAGFRFDESDDDEGDDRPAKRSGSRTQRATAKKKAGPLVPILVVAAAAAVLVLGGVGATAFVLLNKPPATTPSTEFAQGGGETPAPTAVTTPDVTPDTTPDAPPTTTPTPAATPTVGTPSPTPDVTRTVPAATPSVVPVKGPTAPLMKPLFSVEHQNRTGTVAFAGGHVAMWGNKSGLAVYDAKTGKPTASVPTADYGPNASVLLTPDKLGVGLNFFVRNTLRFWNPATGKAGRAVDTAPALAAAGVQVASDVVVSPDGRYLLVLSTGSDKATERGTLTVYDTTARKAVVMLVERCVWGCFAADGSRAVVVLRDGTVRRFKLPSGEPDGKAKLGTAAGAYPGVLGATADADTLLVAAPVAGDPTFRPLSLFDAATGERRHTFAGEFIPGRGCGAVSADGRACAVIRGTDGTGGVSHEVCVFDGGGTTLLARAVVPTEADPARRTNEFSLALSPDGRRLAVLNLQSGTLDVYDMPGKLPPVAERPKPADRPPVPDATAVAAARADVRTLFAADYAKRPADRKGLAAKLLALAETEKKAADKYAELAEARDAAADAGDVRDALAAVDRAGEAFRTDEAADRLAVVERMAAALTAAAALKEVYEAACAASDEAAADDRFAEAGKLAAAGQAAAKKAELGSAALDAGFRVEQAKAAAEAFAAVQPAVDRLKADPADPTANLAVGRFRCLVQRRWEIGLPLLAKGGDDKLKAAAAADLTGGDEFDALRAVADGWWEYAQRAGDDRPVYEARARHWYFRAAGKAGPLDRKRIELKLAVRAKDGTYEPGLAAAFAAQTPGAAGKLAPRVDPLLDFDGAEWESPGKPVRFTATWTGAIVPPKAGRYRLVANTTDAVTLRVNGKVLVDTVGKGTTAAPPPVTVKLEDGPNPLVVTAHLQSGARATHTVTLQWVPPGSTDPAAVVPDEHLYHLAK